MTRRAGHRYSKFFLAGIVAGALAIAISLITRSFLGGPFLPELASQTLFSLTPGEFESQAVENFGPLAKYTAFTAAVIAYFVLYGLIGVLVEKIHTRFPFKGYIAKALQASIIAYTILLTISVLLIATLQSRTGTSAISLSVLAISLSLPQIVFGFIFSYFFRTRQTQKEPTEKVSDAQRINPNRREFIKLLIDFRYCISHFLFRTKSLIFRTRTGTAGIFRFLNTNNTPINIKTNWLRRSHVVPTPWIRINTNILIL